MSAPDARRSQIDAKRDGEDSPVGEGLVVDRLGVEIGGVRLVSSISYRVEAGQICAIVGASGSGKSLHASALLGTAPHDARITGSITIGGRDLAHRGVAHRPPRIAAHVGQDPSTTFNPLRPVRQQIYDVLCARGLTRAAIELEYTTLMRRLGLHEVAGLALRTPGELSGGQLQRLAFAYAYASDAAVTVLDEPTTALDAPTQRDLARLLPLLAARGSAVVFITHDLALAADVADHLLVFDGGAVVGELRRGPVSKGDAWESWQGAEASPASDLLAAARRRESALTAVLAAAPAAVLATAPAAVLAAVPAGPFATVTAGPLAAVPAGPFATVTAAPLAAAPGVPFATAPILRLEAVTVSTPAGVPILHEVDLAVRAGQRIGVLGASGAGKTTLLLALMGATSVSRGRLLLRDEPVTRVSARGRRALARTVQYVPQHAASSLPPGRDVQSIILQPARDLRGRGEATAHRARELADVVGLPARILRMQADELSGGESQRVCVARALAARPLVMLADEPTSSLDLVLRERTLALLKNMSNELGIALVFVTHDSAAVAEICDELVVLGHGRVVERGATGSLLAQPTSSELRALVESVVRLPVALRVDA